MLDVRWTCIYSFRRFFILVTYCFSMEKKEITENLVKELIIGFGFLEGLWIYAGVNPMSEIAKAFSSIAPEGMFSGFFPLALILLTIVQIILVYVYGGVIGWIALLLAFLGGIFIGTGMFGIILVIVAFFLGLWSFSMEKKITIMDVVEFFQEVFRK